MQTLRALVVDIDAFERWVLNPGSARAEEACTIIKKTCGRITWNLYLFAALSGPSSVHPCCAILCACRELGERQLARLVERLQSTRPALSAALTALQRAGSVATSDWTPAQAAVRRVHRHMQAHMQYTHKHMYTARKEHAACEGHSTQGEAVWLCCRYCVASYGLLGAFLCIQARVERALEAAGVPGFRRLL